MKRILTIAILTTLSLGLMAQQRIYKTDGTIVRGYIVQTDDNSVVYSHKSNLDEPLDSVPASEVYNILYKNGSYAVINASGTIADQGSILSQPRAQVEYKGRKLVSYGGKNISESEWLCLASEANVIDTYGKGRALRHIGIPLWGSGLGFLAIGGCTMLAGIQNGNRVAFVAGETLALFSAPLILTGIPLHCVGNKKMEKSYETFNAGKEKTAQAPTLNIQSSGEGIGLALTF